MTIKWSFSYIYIFEAILYDGLLLYHGTNLLTGQGKYTKSTSEIYST